MINFEKTQLKKIKNPTENTIEKDQKCQQGAMMRDSVSAFRKKKKSPQRKIIVQNYCYLFHPVSQLNSRQPTNFYQEKIFFLTFLRCGLGSGGADLALEVRTWEMRKNEKIKSPGPKSEDLDVCMYTSGLKTLVRHSIFILQDATTPCY